MTKQEFLEKVQPYLKEYALGVFNFGKERSFKQLHWRASSLGSCLRGVYYGREGKLEPKPLDERTKGVFYEGKMKELEMIIKLVLEGNEILHSQIELHNEELDTTGHPDAIIKTVEGQIVLEEIKTVNSRAFWYRVNKETNLFEPYPQHVLQLTFYLHELKEKYPDIVGRLRYRSKDDGTTILVPVTYDESIWQTIGAELSLLNDCWEKGVLPPVPETVVYDEQKKKYVVNFKTQYCDYHHHCLQDPDWERKAMVEAKRKNEDHLNVLQNKPKTIRI